MSEQKGKPGRSRYYGVRVHGKTDRFAALVKVNGQWLHIGVYREAGDAALARDRAALHFGCDATLNFPKRSRTLGPASIDELRASQRRKHGTRTASSYMGVYRSRNAAGGWFAMVKTPKGRRYLGRFDSARVAAMQRDRAVLYLDGARAILNFPNRKLEAASPESLRREYALARRKGPNPRRAKLSQYAGVHVKRAGKFAAAVEIAKGKPRIQLGIWPTERDAATARDRAVLHLKLRDELHFDKDSRRRGPASPEQLRLEARRLTRKKRSESPFVGVSVAEGRGRGWEASLLVAGVQHFLGRFDDPKEAALWRERAVVYHKKERALRNFPGLKVKPASVEQLRQDYARRRKEEKSSHFFGVSYAGANHDVLDRPWVAEFQGWSLGAWETEDDAAEAHDRAALYYVGPSHSALNFPARKHEIEPAAADSLWAEARTSFKARTSSRFLGVYFDHSRKLWAARIALDKRVHFVGRFDSERAAARARDKKARELLGPRARLNFHPITGEALHGGRRRELG